MNTRHMPGTWLSYAGRGEVYVAERTGEHTARLRVIATGATAANARLIAKAPEMYERIKQLAEDLEDGHWSNTKAALRKLVAEVDGEQA